MNSESSLPGNTEEGVRARGLALRYGSTADFCCVLNPCMLLFLLLLPAPPCRQFREGHGAPRLITPLHISPLLLFACSTFFFPAALYLRTKSGSKCRLLSKIVKRSRFAEGVRVRGQSEEGRGRQRADFIVSGKPTDLACSPRALARLSCLLLAFWRRPSCFFFLLFFFPAAWLISFSSTEQATTSVLIYIFQAFIVSLFLSFTEQERSSFCVFFSSSPALSSLLFCSYLALFSSHGTLVSFVFGGLTLCRDQSFGGGVRRAARKSSLWLRVCRYRTPGAPTRLQQAE